MHAAIYAPSWDVPARYRRATYLALLLAALTLAFAPGAHAQDKFEDMSPQWWRSVVAQHLKTFDAPLESIRRQSVENIAYFATHYRDRAEYELFVTRLLDVFETETDEDLRLTALSALQAIGDGYSIRRLSELVREEKSDRVRRRTLEALSAFQVGVGT